MKPKKAITISMEQYTAYDMRHSIYAFLDLIKRLNETPV